MCKPGNCGVFGADDVEFADKLLRRAVKQSRCARVDLERPTFAENADIGVIKDSWSVRNPFKRIGSRAMARYARKKATARAHA